MTQTLAQAENSPPLRRNRTFLAVWAGQAVSDVGSQVSTLAIPLVAVLTLHASTFQVGVLRSLAMLAFLLVSLPAGPLVDRWRRRSVLLWCDLLRAAAMTGLLVALMSDLLAMWQLYTVAFVTGTASVVFGIAFDSYRVGIVPRSRLAEANSRFAVTESVSRFAGPGLGATLVSWAGALAAVLLDALSYLVSFVLLAVWGDHESDRGPERDARSRTGPRGLLHEMGEGISFVRSDRVLRRLTAYTAVGNLTLFAGIAVMLVFMVDTLRMSTTTVGLVFMVGEAGGFLSGLLAARLMRVVGSARVLWVAAVCAPVAFIPVFATPGNAVVVLSLYMLCSSARFVVYDIAQYTYRQSVCPPELLGRMTASIRWVVGTSAAVGSLLGGWLGVAASPRATLAGAAVVLTAAALLLVLSPLRGARDLDELIGPSPTRP
ncbi:MFS transporter [Kitasatospora sp. NPDC056446]|uniref:MFS transporter n=1 Tax=Kitasatospora sp. NPDC056446 TaxID=3345819 RepID=UPI00369B321B